MHLRIDILKISNILTCVLILTFLFGHQNSYGNSSWHWADSTIPQDKLVIVDSGIEIIVSLDMGAHVSVISKDLFDTLGGELGDEAEDITVPADGAVYNLRRSKPISIYLSDNKVPLTISPFVFDTSTTSKSTKKDFEKFLKTNPLILGMEDMWKTNFRINYSSRTSEFKVWKDKIPSPKGASISLLLDVEIGEQTVKCLVDTGAPDLPGIYIPKNHPKFETLKSKFKNFYPQRQVFSASDLTLATHDLEGKVYNFEGKGLFVEFEDAPNHDGVGDTCLIGGGILNESVITKFGPDSVHTVGRLPPVEYSRLGFSEIYYDPDSGHFTLTRLFPHGALALAGVKPGDRLLSVQGIEMTLENVQKTKALMRRDAGEKISVRVATPLESGDSSDIRDLTVTLTNVLANQ